MNQIDYITIIRHNGAQISHLALDASGGNIDWGAIDPLPTQGKLVKVPACARIDKKDRHMYSVEVREYTHYKGSTYPVVTFHSFAGSGTGREVYNGFKDGIALIKDKAAPMPKKTDMQQHMAHYKALADIQSYEEDQKKLRMFNYSVHKWRSMSPCTESDYFTKKGLPQAHDLLDIRAGTDKGGDFIAIELVDQHNAFAGYERIYKNDHRLKKSSAGSPAIRLVKLRGINSSNEKPPLVLTEGIADAIVAYEAFGRLYDVAAVIGASSLVKCARGYANSRLVVCILDHDHTMQPTLDKLRGCGCLYTTTPQDKDLSDLYSRLGCFGAVRDNLGSYEVLA